MNLDINKVMADVLSVLKGTVEKNQDKVESVAKQFVLQNKDTLLMIAQLRLSGELSDEEAKSRIEDQKFVLEAQFNALQVVSKAIAQQAANAVFDVLEKAAVAAVKLI